MGENQIEKFQFFPNPTNANVTFVSPEVALGSSVRFYNNLGQLVLSRNIENPIQNLSLESLNAGIYYFTISTSEKVLQGKIIKN